MRADNVVNATGVWADRLRPEELHDEAEVPRIRPSRGTHITLAHETLPLAAGAIVPGRRRARDLRAAVAGVDARRHHRQRLRRRRPRPRAARPRTTSTTCSTRSTRSSAPTLGPADVTGAYAGVRPLISTGDPKKSVDISRKAELYETSSGMITITGGKLTTWRRMAKMAVDRLVEREARTRRAAPTRSRSARRSTPRDLPRVEGVPEEAYERLAGRYGHAAHDVLALAGERGELAQPIVPGGPADLLAEAVYAARREQAASVGDALLRRTRVGLLAARGVADAEGATARRVAAAMARRAGLGRRRRRRPRARAFLDEAAAEGIVPDAVTFSALAGCIPATGPVDPKEPRPSPWPAASPCSPRSRRSSCPPSPAPPRRRASSPATPIDGPSADIQSLGDLDVARDGTGALAYVKRVGGVDHVFVSRLVDGAFQPPEQVDAGLAGAGSQPVVAARTAAGSSWPSSAAAASSPPCGPAGAPGYAASSRSPRPARTPPSTCRSTASPT